MDLRQVHLLLARKAKLPQLGVPSRLETLERILAGNILLKFSINSNLARVSKTFARLYLFYYLPPPNFALLNHLPLGVSARFLVPKIPTTLRNMLGSMSLEL